MLSSSKPQTGHWKKALSSVSLPTEPRGRKKIAFRMKYEGGEGIESSNFRQEAIQNSIGSPRSNEVQKNRETHVKNFHPLYDAKNSLLEPIWEICGIGDG